MDKSNSTTFEATRKRCSHLTLEERGMIQALHREGKTLRYIAEAIGCAHTTVWNELKRGTPAKKHNKGRAPLYTAKRGQKVYERHRSNCRKPCKIDGKGCEAFIQWLTEKVRKCHWSFDAAVGYARLDNLFNTEQMLSTKTLYNMIHAGKLPISMFELPKILKQKPRRNWVRKNKRIYGRSIDTRSDEVSKRLEIGHWEADTVVGHRKGKEAVIFTLVERATRYCIAIKVSGRTSPAITEAMTGLHDVYKDHFSDVFKSITADNGPEFSTLSDIENWHTDVYFTHPYSSWERGSNERHNAMLREFVPKGVSIEKYTAEEIEGFADTLNSRPRRILNYHSAEELFENFLDNVYST